MYLLSIWVVFWAQNSLNKGSLFGGFSYVGFSRNWQNMAKNVYFYAKKFIIKVGMMAIFGNYKGVAF